MLRTNQLPLVARTLFFLLTPLLGKRQIQKTNHDVFLYDVYLVTISTVYIWLYTTVYIHIDTIGGSSPIPCPPPGHADGLPLADSRTY